MITEINFDFVWETFANLVNNNPRYRDHWTVEAVTEVIRLFLGMEVQSTEILKMIDWVVEQELEELNVYFQSETEADVRERLQRFAADPTPEMLEFWAKQKTQDLSTIPEDEIFADMF